MKMDYIETEEILYCYAPYAKEIAKWLSPSKVRHSISTASYASYIARKIEKQSLENKLIIAGLLHDICRELPPYEMLKKSQELGIPIGESEKHNPILLHGPLSAEIAKRNFDGIDEDIYEAIYWHTTGKENFGLIGIILYIADFSEPLRKYSQAHIAREIFDNEGLRKTLLYCIEQRLSLKKHSVLPQALAFLNWVREKNTDI
ncbi:MAG: bis(5'-nucleosyl)-tetraphosphatase (symmetrical) YqeK [Candidatus Hydrogenedentes bacterium]|nr:bis(5'-nucleosyl)-tetraphosphatase (symmetrical) YqeK [Candidatus Hydrogenedentota bacterium]